MLEAAWAAGNWPAAIAASALAVVFPNDPSFQQKSRAATINAGDSAAKAGDKDVAVAFYDQALEQGWDADTNGKRNALTTPVPAAPVAATPPPIATAAPPVAAAKPSCQYVRGFADFVRLIGSNIAGDCVENEHPSATNRDNIEQRTAKGLLVWSNSKRLAMFTDGGTSWYGCGSVARTAPSGQTFDCSQAQATAAPAAKDPNFGAITACEKFVKDRLKAPSTAKFSGWFDSVTQTNSDGTVIVRSYIDAENSFGASMRNHYICKVQETSTSWRLIELSGLN